MFVAGQWWGVCNDEFSIQDAHVVCRQLELGHAAEIVNVDGDHLLKIFDERLDSVYNR